MELAERPARYDRVVNRLFVVATTSFTREGGLFVAPVTAPPELPSLVHVELVRPDGTRTRALMRVVRTFANPPPPRPVIDYVFATLGPSDVPEGTAVLRV